MLGVRWTLVFLVVPIIGSCSVVSHKLSNTGHITTALVESLLDSSTDGANSLREASNLSRRTWSMRLCNAFAYESAIEVFHTHGRLSGLDYTNSSRNIRQKLTEASGPLPYKRCADVEEVELSVDSILEFRIGSEMQIGTFLVNDLPAVGSLLQLAIKRRDTWSTAADFSSHIFSASAGPQIALVDAYLGGSKSFLEVWDAEKSPLSLEKGLKRHQEVHFGSVIEVAPGDYDWLLKASSGYEKAVVKFKATGTNRYTVLRVGADAIGGQSFPEELVVWPNEGVILRRGANSESDKGLFGIPKDFLKSGALPLNRLAQSVGIVLLGLIIQLCHT